MPQTKIWKCFSSSLVLQTTKTPCACPLSLPLSLPTFRIRIPSFSLSSPTHSKKRSNQEKKRKKKKKHPKMPNVFISTSSSLLLLLPGVALKRRLARPRRSLVAVAVPRRGRVRRLRQRRRWQGALACATRGGGRAPPARAPTPPPPPPSRSPALSSPPPLPPLTPHTLSSITFSTSALQHLSLLFKDELGLCRGKGRRDLPRRCRRSERAVAAHRAGLAVLRFLSLFFFPLSPRA